MSAPAQVSFREALRFWLKLGFISFGGPAGQISIMHRELVEARRWISERRFLHALNYCMVLPGPEAQQLATYIGWLMHGRWGGIVAGTLFVLPSLAILIALSWIYMRFGDVPSIGAILYGIKPAVTAIVFAAAWRIGMRTLRNAALWSIAIAAFLALFAFDLPFPYVVLGAALIGMIGGKLAPAMFALSSPHGVDGKPHAPAIIDDDTPSPPHARFSWLRLVITLAVALGLWGTSLAMLAASFGWQADATQLGWFFTKAALMTFGGAYAVLPYVVQGAVENYGWLNATQMIDGLALGETTPGPLIMVVAFVGYVGGWTKAILGAGSLALAGIAGACIATWFTFLPSFLFILAGGPLVERTHGEVGFTAPLTAVTAAVVGVIVNLAAFFAWKVIWPAATPGAPFSGGFDAFSAVMAIAGIIALTRFKAGVIPLIAVFAAAGLAARLLA